MQLAQASILDPTSFNNSQVVSQVFGDVNRLMAGRRKSDDDAESMQQAQMAAKRSAQYNNKIIINQQHYFTDSIKIYQNDGKNTGQATEPKIIGGR